MPDGQDQENKVPFVLPRVLAWEVTRQCPLKCQHCRAGAANIRYADELSTDEGRRVIDALPPLMVIWTGGEPMLRPAILDLVKTRLTCAQAGTVKDLNGVERVVFGKIDN